MTYKQQQQMLTMRLWRYNSAESMKAALIEWKNRREGHSITRVQINDDLRQHGLSIGDQFKMPQDSTVYEVVS